MTADSQAFDPYRSPSLPEGPYAGAPAVGRPGWLTTLCVLCIVLGVLGLMNSLLGTFGVVAGSSLQKAFQPRASSKMPQGMQDAQNEFQEKINSVQGKYLWATVPALAVRAVAALLLLIGGVRCLSLVEGGRKALLVGLAVAVVFELLHSILQSVVAMDMMTIVNEYVEKVLQSLPKKNGGPDLSKIMPTIVRWSILGSLVFTFLIAVGKIALYIFGLIYLQKPYVRALFGTVQSPMSIVQGQGF
jgi:hypothetical protein